MRSTYIVCLGLIIALMPALSSAAKSGSASESSFRSFVKRLDKAVAAKDREYIETILSPSIGVALGGGSGKKEFNKTYDNLATGSVFWTKMARILPHGWQATGEDNELSIPAVTFKDSDSELPQAVAWEPHTPMLQAPDERSRVLGYLNADQVAILEPSQPQPINSKWAKVRTANGTVGYVLSTGLYSAYDEYATFRFTNGRWLMTWFGAAGL